MSGPTKQCKTSVAKHITEHFPEMAGAKLKVSTAKHGGETRHRFTYRKALRSANGVQSQQIVHLTTDENGKVLKVSVSR
jgi:hypothetical protein